MLRIWMPLALLPIALLGGELRGDENLKRWTPGGNTNAADLPYRHAYTDYERQNDDDWLDGRWQQTAKGPILSHSVQLPGHQLGPKIIAVHGGREKFLLYDLTAGSFVAGATGAELRTDPARFGMLGNPQLLGDVCFAVSAAGLWRRGSPGGGLQPVPISRRDYQGLHLHGDRVVLVTRIDGVEVLEANSLGGSASELARKLEVEPHDEELVLSIAAAKQDLELDSQERVATWTDRAGEPRWVALVDASLGVRLMHDRKGVSLRLPASHDRSFARLSYGVGSPRTPPESFSNSDGSPNLDELRQPGPQRWGKPLVTQGVLAEDSAAYVVDTITVPHDNPFDALFFLAGLSFFSGGDAAVCAAHGDVWIVRGLDRDLRHVTWQRFATGLYQPLGLEVIDDQVYVLGRDQITRLHDLNDDGEADYYESFNHDLVIQGRPHAYAMRLERAPDGSLLFLKSGEGPHGSALLRVSSDGQKLEVVARGFRHAFGLGVGPRGEVTVADNEGNWVPSSKIDLVEPNGFYGFLGSAADSAERLRPARPLCYLPKVADNSSGGQFWHTSPDWGAYHRNELFHFSWGRCTLHAVLRQQVGEIWQAATVEVPAVTFQAGPAEAAFHPLDGQLYVVGLNGWQTAAKADGSFQRVRYTGRPLHLPSRFAARTDGIEIEFTQPLDPASAANVANYRIEQWNYRWSSDYGSFHYSVADPERVGHDTLPVEQAVLAEDRKHLFLKVPGLAPVDQLHLALSLRSEDGTPLETDLYATLHALAPPECVDDGAPWQQLLAEP